MKIDAHQHFWYYNPVEYSWIGENMALLKRDFLPADLKFQMEQAGFSGTLVVQARQTLEETRWLLSLAEENTFIKGVVGWVDLCSPSVKTRIDEFIKHTKFAGVRHVIHDEPDDNFMLRNEFLRGMEILQSYNLVYDLLLFPKHLPNAVKLVEKFPDQKFVLDHIGKPRIKEKLISPWKEDLARLAGYKNVSCKLSGMVTEADWQNWSPDDFIPYIDTVLGLFGSQRLMIGSDWPVCNVVADYATVMDLVTQSIQGLSEKEKSAILGENCIEIYQLRD